MNHSFDVDIAVKHGVHAAVLHQTITFWVLKNKANGKHLHEGRHWTYNSAKAFSELFPYLSADQIQRSLKRLEAAGLVVTGCFNTSPYDRTRWYSTAEGCVTDSAELRNEFPQDCGISVDSSNQFTSPKAPKGGASRGIALCAWLESLKASGAEAIPADDPVFSYAAKSGIPDNFLALAWTVFKTDHIEGSGSKKLQKDWRQTFRSYVEKNYLKLWYVSADGQYVLTTPGIQAHRAHEATT